MAKIFPVQQRAKLDFQPIPGDTVELDGLVEEHVRADRLMLGSILRLGERFTTTTVVADWNRFAASMMSIPVPPGTCRSTMMTPEDDFIRK